MPSARHLLIAFMCALSALLVGCASIGAPLPPSLELIKPPSDLRAVRKGDHVYLSWTIPTHTIDRQTVRHRGPTLICRSRETSMSECGAPAGSVAPDANTPAPNTVAPNAAHPQATFVDQIPNELIDSRLHASFNPDNSIPTLTYAVEALNTSSRAAGLSNQVQVLLVPTIPPPADFRAELTPSGVRLTWSGELLSLTFSRVRYFYRVYRRLAGSDERNVVGQVARGFDAAPSVLDQTFAWEKHYEYWMNVVTEVEIGHHACPMENGLPGSCADSVEIEGDDTPVQSIFPHDIYPPAIPTGLQAVFSGPGQQPFIDVLWAPDTDADLAGYNLYRHMEGAAFEKVNADLVKTPSYRDQDVVSGKKYFYSVSAVDLRGNESARSEETSEQVP
jgi:hypothetical protein